MENETNKISSMRKKTHKKVDNIMDKAKSAQENGQKTKARIKERANIMKGNVDGYIKENPERSVLIAAGIGIAAGAIFTATMMRSKH